MAELPSGNRLEVREKVMVEPPSGNLPVEVRADQKGMVEPPSGSRLDQEASRRVRDRSMHDALLIT